MLRHALSFFFGIIDAMLLFFEFLNIIDAEL